MFVAQCPEVGRMMLPIVLAATKDQGLAELAGKMMAAKLNTVPVVNDNRLEGTLRLKDIFRYVNREMA